MKYCVVGDVRQFGLDRPPQSQYFIDMRQVPTDPAFRMPPLLPVGAYYLVRTSQDPMAILPDVRGAVVQLSPGATLDHVETMERIVSNSMTRPRMYAVLVAIFSSVAVVLAAVGLYGVMAYSVSQRTREIGVRMAIGATEGDVQRQFLTEAVVMSLIGGAVGIAVGVIASFTIASTAGWPILVSGGAIAGAALVAMAIGIFFGYYPAQKAARLDPIEALRYE